MAKTTEKSAERSEIQAPKAVEPNAASSSNGTPSREQIEIRAYRIYLERGSVDGLDVQDWLQAESELTAEGEGDTTQAKAAGA